MSIISTPHLSTVFFYEVTFQLNQPSNTANAPAVQAPTQGRCGDKSCPCSSSTAQISTAGLARLSPGVWAFQESSASTQPTRCPPPPPVLKAPQGATKATRTAKDMSITSPLLLQSLENNHHNPKQQSRNHKSVQETSLLP